MGRRARYRTQPSQSRGEGRGQVTRLALARHLEAFSQYSGDPLLLFDAEDRIVEANERAVETYGHPRQVLMNLGADDLCGPGGMAEVRRRVAAGPRGGVACEAIHRRADGSAFPVEVSARLITLEGASYLQAIVRDISERKHAEEALAYQAMLLAHMNDAVMGLDERFLLRAWNQAAERIYGWRAEEVLDKPILRVLDTQYRRGGLDQAALSRLMEDGRMRLEMRQRRKDGTVIDVEGVSVALRDAGGRITGYVAVNRDVTDRRRAEEALRLSEERLKLALEATGDGLWELNLQSGRGYLSPRWAEPLGLPGGDLEDAQAALEPIAPDQGSADEERVGEHRAGRSPWYEYEKRLQLPRGESRWALVRGKVVERGPRGEPLRLIGTLSDVTEKKKLQAQLIQSDRMASMGTLAAGVAHEINNPLAYVVANLGWAVQTLGTAAAGRIGAEDHAEVVGALEEARGGAERVRAIVRDLKTFSRSDETARGPADVRRVLASALNLARNEIRHCARAVTELGEVPLVDASEHRLGQVFLNLLVNAAQAIPEGRALHNEIRAVTRTDERGRAVVEIRDTGCGIAPEHLGSIFEPFFTTKPAGVGTGLGLAICHGIVTGLGGSIQVESTPGKGSLFRVILPAAAGREARDPPGAVPEPRARGRILVVDDEALVGRAIQRILGREHEVVAETSARAALARVGRGERFDLVLCDLMMPEMTGPELHQALGRWAPELADRVVFLTGGAFTPTAREFLDRTSRPRLEKPFEAEALRRLVAAELGRAAR